MKICAHETCFYPVFGKGYCRSHQYLRADIKSKTYRLPDAGKTTPRTAIRKVSKKLAQNLKEYSALRAKFLNSPLNMFCAVFPHLRATEIHHMAGRGRNLNKTETWLAVSREGHLWIESNPKLSRERGFTMDRLKMTDDLNEN